jgi:crotonobetainyl-CoA:carnitine CoA-transferase CaiB-like acyl-CoA transferase
VVPDSPPAVEDPVRRERIGDAPPLDRPPVVVDLSSLWAGPLCSHLLQAGGARVIKVESIARPDGARADPTGFFDLLNHGKASVALDLPSTYGLAQLRRLLAVADVVIEGSRPRVLRQWGIDPLRLADGPRVWLSITGHGRDVDRVGFGDDAAAAGGLIASDAEGPMFLADAVADPLAGIAAHRAVAEALAEGGRWLLDVALARVAASVAGPRAGATPIDGPVPSPQARPVPGPAAELGADTDAVLAEL